MCEKTDLNEKPGVNYDAFISYRHVMPDQYAAEKLHHLLETFTVPKAIRRNTGISKINRVFRDKEELPIASDLASNIRAALENSNFLIVICSPKTPESYWVQREIETFISLHGRSHVLAILADGEPEQSFPAILRFEEIEITDESGNKKITSTPVEPLAADVRGGSLKAIHKLLKKEMLRIAAPLLSCGYDDLRQRHRERRTRKILAASTFFSVLFLAFGSYSAWQSFQIHKNYEKQLINQSRYLSETSARLLEAGDRTDAILVALEALPSDGGRGRPYVPQAEYALNNALYTYETALDFKPDKALKHELYVQPTFEFSPSGKTILSFDQGTKAYVWNTEDGSLIAQIAPRTDEKQLYDTWEGGWLVDDDTLLLYSNYGVECLRVSDQSLLWKNRELSFISHGAVNEDLTKLAVYENQTLCLIDIINGTTIMTVKNPDKSHIFTRGAVISDDGLKLAVPCLGNNEDTAGSVLFYDVEKKEAIPLKIGFDQITSLIFYKDMLITASLPSDLKMNHLYKTIDGKIEGFRPRAGAAALWSCDFPYSNNLTAAIRGFRSHSYKGEDGSEHAFLVYLSGNQAFNISPENGSMLYTFTGPSVIEGCMFSSASPLALIACGDGSICYVDFMQGTEYQDNGFQISYPVRHADFKGGRIAISTNRSNSIVLYRFPVNENYKEHGQADGTIEGGSYSPTGQYMAINYWNNDYLSSLMVLDGADKKTLFELSLDQSIVLNSFQGKGDEKLFTALQDATLTLYDCKTGQKQKEIKPADLTMPQYRRTADSNLLLVSDDTVAYMINMENLDIVNTMRSEDLRRSGSSVLSIDGKYLLHADMDNKLSVYDTASMKRTETDDSYRLQSDQISSIVAGSRTNIAAVCCSDSKIRVLDLENGNTLDEFDFPCLNQFSVAFSPDDGKLFTQGDDGIIRVYDLKSHKFIKEEQSPSKPVRDWVFLDALSLIEARSIDGIQLYASGNYEKIADMVNYLDISPAHMEAFAKSGTSYGSCPYLTLEQSMKQAAALVGSASLTPEERVRYNID